MAKPKNMRLKWAHKILRAKNFVVMTDKESIIALEGISPSSLNDVLVLQEQTASLRNFMSLMEDLMQEHDKAIEKAMGGQQREKAKTNAPTKRKSVHKQAISQNPAILEVQPILVNEKMEVIDGQHRLTAASELGLPVTYNQIPGLGISTARDMNVLQRKWGMLDYARSYAKGGNIYYKAFLRYTSEYPGMAPSILLVAMGKSGRRQSTSGEFRSGEFVITRDEEEVEEILERFQAVKQTISVPFSRALASALLIAFDNEEFEWSRFFSKLQQKPEAIQRSTVIRDYLRMIEDIYNRDYTDSNRTRLF